MAENPYSALTHQLKHLTTCEPDVGRRVTELISLNELLTTLNTARGLEETLEIMLLTILGEYPCMRGAIFLKHQDSWELGLGRGIKSLCFDTRHFPSDDDAEKLPTLLDRDQLTEDHILMPIFQKEAFQYALKLQNEGRLVGFICLGLSRLGPLSPQKGEYLGTLADFGGVIIGNHAYRSDLEQINRQLQRHVFQLKTLYEITGAFARCYENEDIYQILANNLMGQFFISRCAILEYSDTCVARFVKGVRSLEPDLGTIDAFKQLEHWPNGVFEQTTVECPKIAEFMTQNRFRYALLIASQENRVGLLLLGNRMDRKELTDEDKDFILSLSQQAAVAVENIRLQQEALEKKRMERELQLAREIQQKLLPKSVPEIAGYQIAVEMRAYYQVGGDFFDFVTQPDGVLSICLADVSGKGLPASMIMSTAQASLRALHSFPGLSPKDILQKLNLHLCNSTQNNKFVTLFLAVINPETNRMQYINAGHNRPILLAADGSYQLLDKGGMVVGLFPMAQYQVGEISFEVGSELLIYTDGLSEVTDEAEEEFGDDRLIEVLRQQRGKGSAVEAKDSIVGEALKFSKGQMVDDLTVLLVRREA